MSEVMFSLCLTRPLFLDKVLNVEQRTEDESEQTLCEV